MKEMTFNQLEGMTVEALSIRGKGVFLEQSCSYVGISEYGTNKDKAERLLAWRDKNKGVYENENERNSRSL